MGQRGTAGAWPSSRGIRGLITQSPTHGHSKHSALMSAINVTFVNYTLPDGQFKALEHCGKCKDFQVWVSYMSYHARPDSGFGASIGDLLL